MYLKFSQRQCNSDHFIRGGGGQMRGSYIRPLCFPNKYISWDKLGSFKTFCSSLFLLCYYITVLLSCLLIFQHTLFPILGGEGVKTCFHKLVPRAIPQPGRNPCRHEENTVNLHTGSNLSLSSNPGAVRCQPYPFHHCAILPHSQLEYNVLNKSHGLFLLFLITAEKYDQAAIRGCLQSVRLWS